MFSYRCRSKQEKYDPFGRRCVPYKSCLESQISMPCSGIGMECRENGQGSFFCECTKGFDMIDGRCVLKNYCEFESCGGFGKCQNIVGGFVCNCIDTYYFTNKTCVSSIIIVPTTPTTPTIPPTTPNPNECDLKTTERVDIDGTRFFCRCKDGYVPSEYPTRCQRMFFDTC